MSRAADKAVILILALSVMALVWKLYKREDARTEGDVPTRQFESKIWKQLQGQEQELAKRQSKKEDEKVTNASNRLGRN